jgi:archaeal type IV pilus assembly protein PilA
MKSFRRSRKGISPIFATLILIAIAVIAGVVVYMFTSGTLATMTGGGTAGQEKVAVQSASVATGDTAITVYYQSTSGPLPTITGLVVKNSSGNSIATITTIAGGATPTATGVLTQLTATAPASTLTSGSAYTLTLVTKAGGSFVSPSFIAP